MLKIIIGLIVILIIVGLAYLLSEQLEQTEHMISIGKLDNTHWARPDCPNSMNKLLREILNERNINNSLYDPNAPVLLLPCSYNDMQEQIKELERMNKNKNNPNRIYIINGADNISSKDILWSNLKTYWGLNKASKIMPMTYLLYEPKDIARLKQDYKPNNLYIMKKNMQRQEGLTITRNLDQILNANPDEWVLVQKLLQDPYIIDSRKINMRFYVLVICNGSNIDSYVYSDGFMYYTAEPFEVGSENIGPNITTGYIDRKVYETNPLTHTDLRKYLDNHTRKLNPTENKLRNNGYTISKILFSRIYKLLGQAIQACSNNICGQADGSEFMNKSITFQLFGADIAINDKLEPMLMEINKGPDMTGKDLVDTKLKKNCMENMLELLGVIEKSTDNTNGFIKILDLEQGTIINPFE